MFYWLFCISRIKNRVVSAASPTSQFVFTNFNIKAGRKTSVSLKQSGRMMKEGNVNTSWQKETGMATKRQKRKRRWYGGKTKSGWRWEWGRYSGAILLRKTQQCHGLPHSWSHYPDKFKDVITQILFFLVVISINYQTGKKATN